MHVYVLIYTWRTHYYCSAEFLSLSLNLPTTTRCTHWALVEHREKERTPWSRIWNNPTLRTSTFPVSGWGTEGSVPWGYETLTVDASPVIINHYLRPQGGNDDLSSWSACVSRRATIVKVCGSTGRALFERIRILVQTHEPEPVDEKARAWGDNLSPIHPRLW